MPFGAQNARDRRTADAVAQVLQRALNARVAPRRVLSRHPNDQRSKVCLQASGTAAAGAIRPFARHQLAVPAQNGVRRHDGRDLREQPATEPVSQFGEASALAVVETQALPGEPGLQQSILFAQERDDVGLLTMEPAAQGRDQQLEREHARSLRHGGDPPVGHYGINNELIEATTSQNDVGACIRRRQRLGGILNYDSRAA